MIDNLGAMQRWTTNTADVYCETLDTPRRPFQNKRRGKLLTGVIFLHNIARSHIAAKKLFQEHLLYLRRSEVQANQKHNDNGMIMTVTSRNVHLRCE